MPKAAKEHRVHPVDVRDEFLAVFPAESDQKCQHCRNDQNHSENPPVLGQSRGQESDAEDDRIRAECAIAVASKRDVKIVLKPFGKGNMPPLPELSGVAGLVRRIEVLRQIETHQHRDTGGDVSVPGEVGIDLKRVAEQGRKVLESCVKKRVLEDPVTEIHGQIVAQDQLLGKSVQNPENRDPELSATKEERLVKLREELLGPHYRACDELREEAEIESEIPEIADRRDRPAGDIHHIADGLEDEERDADRQEDRVDAERLRAGKLVSYDRKPVFHNEFRPEKVVHHISHEVGVLVVAQKRQVHNHTQCHNSLTPEIPPYT